MTDRLPSQEEARELRRWADRLERAARPSLGPLPEPGSESARAYVEGFADDHGHRRPVDRPFLSALFGLRPPLAGDELPADVRLWTLATDPDARHEPNLAPQGPLTAQRPGEPIEVWTEADLSALHALWRVARRLDRGDLRERALACARWHVTETQPDNATNHPWGVHVFAALGTLGDDPGATHYAGGLLHACQLTLGRPDRLSALILWDGAAELRTLAGPS